MPNTLLAFLFTSIAGLSTMLGSLFIFKKNKNSTLIGKALSFASGVMICVSIIDLIPEGLTLLAKNYILKISILIGMTSLASGIILSMLLDKYLPDTKEIQKGGRLYRIGIISMLAIIFHNIPEGIATFMTTSNDVRLGLSITIAILLHNIPEGISISIPIYYSTKSKKKSLWYTFISGISEPFGALIAYLFLSPLINDIYMGCLLLAIAGIMIHIGAYELLPTSRCYQDDKTTVTYFLLGVITMYLSHMLF